MVGERGIEKRTALFVVLLPEIAIRGLSTVELFLYFPFFIPTRFSQELAAVAGGHQLWSARYRRGLWGCESGYE